MYIISYKNIVKQQLFKKSNSYKKKNNQNDVWGIV